jgi:hypothetical protein
MRKGKKASCREERKLPSSLEEEKGESSCPRRLELSNVLSFTKQITEDRPVHYTNASSSTAAATTLAAKRRRENPKWYPRFGSTEGLLSTPWKITGK